MCKALTLQRHKTNLAKLHSLYISGAHLMLKKALVLAATLLSPSVYATDYTIQIGAYQLSTEHAIEQAKTYGDVFQGSTDDQLTKIYIGRFNNRTQAEQKRDQLQSSGFHDAFITTLLSDIHFTTLTDNTPAQKIAQQVYQTQVNSTPNTVPSIIGFDDLNSAERSKASYLDDELRILSNGKFYTIEQYRLLHNDV